MKCHQALESMSLALDRRLDAAGRRLLAHHVRGCACCAHDYRSLKQAMNLAGQLRTHTVSPTFREEVFRRIEAGEGTPVGAIRDVIPFAAKVRFAALGAAAAALVLLSAGYFLPGGPLRGDRRIEMEMVTRIDGGGQGATPGTLVQGGGGLRPMAVANAVDGTRQAFMNLQAAAHRAQQLPPEKAIPEVLRFAIQADERTQTLRLLTPFVGNDVIEEMDRWRPWLKGVQDLSPDTPPAEFQRKLAPFAEMQFIWVDGSNRGADGGRTGPVRVIMSRAPEQR